jgi:hypothetical protein
MSNPGAISNAGEKIPLYHRLRRAVKKIKIYSWRGFNTPEFAPEYLHFYLRTGYHGNIFAEKSEGSPL